MNKKRRNLVILSVVMGLIAIVWPYFCTYTLYPLLADPRMSIDVGINAWTNFWMVCMELILLGCSAMSGVAAS